MAGGCKKDKYDGGDYSTSLFKADCRQTSGYGDLFSWEAINQYKSQLCPNGWRVPTMQDFVDLDIALGGTGKTRGAMFEDDASIIQFINDNYLNPSVWGGSRTDGANASYWSLQECHSRDGRFFTLCSR